MIRRLLILSTGLYAGGMFHKFREVASRYLKGWFLVDVIATFPWALVLPGSTGTALVVLRLLRLAYLLRVLQVVKVSSVVLVHSSTVVVMLYWSHMLIIISAPATLPLLL